MKDKRRERKKKNVKEEYKGKDQQKQTKKSCRFHTKSFHWLLFLNDHANIGLDQQCICKYTSQIFTNSNQTCKGLHSFAESQPKPKSKSKLIVS